MTFSYNPKGMQKTRIRFSNKAIKATETEKAIARELKYSIILKKKVLIFILKCRKKHSNNKKNTSKYTSHYYKNSCIVF